MWLDVYNTLTNAEKERFSKVTCYLLNKNFVTREIYENRDRAGKINADYRFIEKYEDLFFDYLKVINYKLERNDTYGFYFLENEYGYNKLRLDKLTTLILFTLRNIFDEEKEKNNSGNVVFITNGSLVYKLLDLKKVKKKTTMKNIIESLKILLNQNVISKIEGSIEESTCLLAILPTITNVVSNEKIDAIYSMVFSEEIESEQIIEKNKDEDLEDVFNL